MSRLLHVPPHGTESLVYNAYPRKAAASTWLTLNSGANAAPALVQALMLAMLEPKLQAVVFSIKSLTRDEWSYPQLL